MKKLTLKNTIMVNGQEVNELTYDENEINGMLFATAESKKKTVAGANMSISPAAEFDFGLHLYLGYAAIIAVNPAIDWSDLERVKGHDIMDIMKIGRSFMLGSDEGSQGNASAEPIGTTAESTTPAKPIYKKSE